MANASPTQNVESLMKELQAAKTQLERMGQSLQAAEARLQIKEEFVAKVSHELRTPLTSIKEGISLMLDGALGPTSVEQRDFLGTMNADLDRLTELINNMLDISKIEAGKMRLVRTRVDLAELLDSVIRSQQPIFGRRKVQKAVQAMPPVLGDMNRLHQVFANLLSNALKFTPDDGKIVFNVSNTNGQVAVAVEDNGTGIAASDIPKLFHKFSQVGPRNLARPRGTGLGLVMCKELVELHHGSIDVASTPGRGSVFTVHLPMYSDHLAVEEELRDFLEQAEGEEGDVGMITLQADAKATPLQLKALFETVSRNIHQGDRVVAMDSFRGLVVLAIANLSGLQAIVKRLHSVLPSTPRITFGVALCQPGRCEVAELITLSQSAQGRALAYSP